MKYWDLKPEIVKYQFNANSIKTKLVVADAII